MTIFDKAFDLVIGAEGGYVNDPKDPGGETKYGISKKSYPNVDIKNLTLDQAKTIYYNDYWLPICADKLHDRLAIFYFDCAVNQGAPTAKKLIQQHCGVSADGVIGNQTLSAMQKLNDNNDYQFMTLRALKYKDLSNFNTYGKGWYNRLFNLCLSV